MENLKLLDTMRLNETYNPVTLKEDKEIACITGHWTVNAILFNFKLVLDGHFIVAANWPGGGGFLSRKDWDMPLPQGTTIRIIALPRGSGGSNPLQIIATIAIMVAAVYTGGWAAAAWGPVAGSLASAAVMVAGSLLLNMLFAKNIPGTDDGTAKDIYSISDGGNYLRIGQPFAERFGRQKIYPDLVQNIYTRNENNDNYMYFYGIIGVGQYEVEGVFIEETLMDDYAEATYNILPPGNTVLADGRRAESIPTIVTNVVWPCTEISGQALDMEGVIAIVSGRGTSALYIEYDIQFGALIGFNDEGDRQAVSVTVVSEVRLVDDDGVATSNWVELYRKTYTAASIDTLRYSHKVPAPLGQGRYEIKVYRTNEKSTSSQVQDAVSIMGVRAYGGLHPWYGDVTCIEAKIRATDKLSGDVANKINVVATRKLPKVTESGYYFDAGASDPSLFASRSIIDAMAYMVTCENGGRMDYSFVKWDILYLLKNQIDELEHWFNLSFTGQGSVMDACKKAALCSRMVPYMPGGLFCAVRDDFQEVPAITYTDDDYDVDSFKLSHKLPDQSSPTCVKIKFVNEVTWNDDSVVFFDDRGSEDRPYEVKLEGCQSRSQAYQYAAYLYLDMMNNRTSVEFSTGMKAHIPALFKKIALCASNTNWGQSGQIVSVDEVNGLIWCSEPLDFKSDGTGKMYVTHADGSNGGPYTVEPSGISPYCIRANILNIKTMQDDDLNATRYLFGPSSKTFLHVRLMGIRPQGRNKIQMIGSIIDDTIYDFDEYPPDYQSPIIDPGLLAGLSVNYIGDNIYTASWSGSASAYKVEADIGSGYTTIVDEYTNYTQDVETASTSIIIKVTPYDSESTLQTDLAMEVSYSIPSSPQNLTVELTSATLSASWDAVTGASSYSVTLLSEGSSVWETSTTSTEMSVALSALANIETSPDMDIEVYAINSIGDMGDESTAEIPISSLSAPANLALQSVLSGAVIISWGGVTGATGYELYMGSTTDFDPETEGTLVYAGELTNATVAVDLTSPYAYYFKVAGTNVFYDDVDELVFSSSLEVSG